MAEVIPPPAVPGTVHCAVCLVGYEPRPDQALVLAGLGPISGWQRVVARYAIGAGWYQRVDGLLLCTAHADRADRRLTPPGR